MATVKGDVHDIGKNIVGVVLQCNNFDVIDLGVMAPATKILETARERNADIVGLSGLITPSLEEMAHVAHEMQRLGMTQPLLIGGATTSRVHTAVKIAPNYSGVTVYVPDASRAVGVASNLLSTELRDAYVAEVAADYDKVRAQHAGKKGPTLVSLAAARANAFKADWAHYTPPVPTFIGRREFRNVDLAAIARCIDWGPFFQAWELSGPFPAILDDAVVGEAARSLHAEGQAMLKSIIAGRWLTANGVVALLPANAVGDDIVLYADEGRTEVALTWHNLRQQNERPPGRPNYCLADFVAPRESKVKDFLGAFAVTAGLGIERKLAEFEREQGRLQRDHAEGAGRPAGRSLRRVAAPEGAARTVGLCQGRASRPAELIREEYRGIRPAPGYPACPDHAVKAPLFDAVARPGRRHDAHRELRDAARGGGVGILFRPSRGDVLRGGHDRRGSGAGRGPAPRPARGRRGQRSGIAGIVGVARVEPQAKPGWLRQWPRLPRVSLRSTRATQCTQSAARRRDAR